MNTANPRLVGTQVTRQGVYLFQCPVCGKDFRQDERVEPCCTGPSETRDDHELTIMTYVGWIAR